MNTGIKMRTNVARMARFASTLSLCASLFAGCIIAREFRVSTIPSAAPVERLKADSANDSIEVEYWVTGSDRTYMWSGNLHLSIKNRTSDTIVYDWSETTMKIDSVPLMTPGQTYLKNWGDLPPLGTKGIPPGKKLEFTHHYGGTDFLAEFSRSPYLTFRPGAVKSISGELVCDTPTIYAMPTSPSVWQGYHSVGGPVQATIMDPVGESFWQGDLFEERYSISRFPDSSTATDWVRDTCFFDSVVVNVRARGWDITDHWYVAIDVEIENNLRDTIVFRWDSAAVVLLDVLRFQLAGARVRKERVNDSLLIPSRKKILASLYYADTLYFPEFIRTPHVTYHPGAIIASHLGQYDIPRVYAFALYDRTRMNWVREKYGIPH